jgi:endoglucanase
MRNVGFVVIIIVLASLFASKGCSTSPSSSVYAGLAIKVSGNHFVDGSGRTIRLLGLNREGPQYMCTGGRAPGSDGRSAAIFDGPSDDTSIAAMKAWRINVVRLPLNESCWLGINGVDVSAGGEAYQKGIKDYVNRLHASGMYAILELYANAPGSLLAVNQQNGPDADHTPTFWASVANVFRDDPAVLFELFTEPIFNLNVDPGKYIPTSTSAWDCWKSGGCSSTVYDTGESMLNSDGTVQREPDGSGKTRLASTTWQMTGMQQLVDAVRRAGATQPVLIGGINWTLDMSEWVTHLPTDPANQIVASIHLYNFSGGGFNQNWTFDDWKRDPERIAQSYPVVTAEFGVGDQNYKFIDDYMAWADHIGASYLLFTWIRWHENGREVDTGITAISDYSGTPSPMGQRFYNHLQQVAYP